MAVAEQAVILAAGRGTRLQKPGPTVQLDEKTEAIVRQGYKELVPIHGRAYLDYGIDRLVAAGVRRIVLIIAPGAAPLREYAAGLPERFPGITVDCVVQPEARGTGHALRYARPATGSGDFVMLNSDNLYPAGVLKELADEPHRPGYAVGFDQEALIRGSNFDSSRIPSLGILVPRKDRPELLDRVVEKPSDTSDLMSEGRLWVTMNVWRFSPEIYDFCDRVALSARGEYELTSAVQDMIDSGREVRMLRCRDAVLDLTSRADIGHLEARLSP